MSPNPPSPPSTTGLLVLDKPIGMSSMAAVARVRRRAGRVKTGHAGTLDPLATGVLILALGRATRSIERPMATTKRYVTEVDLSAFTATDDAEGERRPVAVAEPPSPGALEQAVAGFVGTIEQRPPAFSAIKVDGRRAYARARKGETVDLPARPVVVHAARLLDYDWPVATVELLTGKGFYVRSFARDLGLALGTGGHCASLRRTAVGPFTEAEARTLEELPETITEDDLLPLEEALQRVEDDPPPAPTAPMPTG